MAVGLVVAHPIILFVVAAGAAGAAQFVPGAVARPLSPRCRSYSLIALVVMALWRAKLKIRYETWHLTHIVLAVVAVAAGVVHMVGWSFYLDAIRGSARCGSA